jgi:hypothetical protein
LITIASFGLNSGNIISPLAKGLIVLGTPPPDTELSVYASKVYVSNSSMSS